MKYLKNVFDSTLIFNKETLIGFEIILSTPYIISETILMCVSKLR
jgi:hypothetical protein